MQVTDIADAITNANSSGKALPGDIAVTNLTAGTAALADAGWKHIADPTTSPPAHMATSARTGTIDKTASGRPLLSRIRGYMVVPVIDCAMILAPLAWRPPQVLSMLALAVLGVLLLTGGTKYTAPLHLSVLDDLPTLLTRLLAATAVVATAILYTHQRIAVLTFLETAAQAIALLVFGRVITTRLIAASRRHGLTRHHTVLIGGGPAAAELARTLREHPEYGLKVEGYVDDCDICPAEQYLPRLGRLADLDMAVVTSGADTLLIADGAFGERALMTAVRTKECLTAELLIVPRMHHFHTQTGMADQIGSIPIMRIRNPNLQGATRVIKRMFDIIVSSVALIALMPVLAAAAIAVRIEGGPGVIFRQVRVGRGGRHFELLKFRSLRPANDIESQTQWNVASDNRVGPVGRFLRSTSIDELPQLWNIFRGDMTIVGPRPERPHFVKQFSSEVDRYAHRHRVQVGLTGFAQVSGLKGNTSILDRARYDNFYIENWSLWLDIKIIIRTFRAVVLYRERPGR
ncbi:exopolysaccharide biosynthesis polyprenyl glycosylphosphotransferase [Mycolicibacterium canariasense]|uniref:Exopolysaccharide biosynthesis polyprenyl glycosylphosphotransferase n=1 Tax=Mycolicibacterium canariasense TaxID=228230 RepID=A0A100W8I2_MYCCR|nr:exopolysaccharide biosynthesis polyprenyl glycosylphosphotransferase [Mycolicibacterium canariasense]